MWAQLIAAELGDARDVLGPEAQVTLFVLPVGGDSVFRDPVHLLGPNLDLDGLVLRPHDRGVQAAVPVGLGHRDVVFETPDHWLVEVVDDPQRTVTGVDRVDDDPVGVDVHDLVERPAL